MASAVLVERNPCMIHLHMVCRETCLSGFISLFAEMFCVACLMVCCRLEYPSTVLKFRAECPVLPKPGVSSEVTPFVVLGPFRY